MSSHRKLNFILGAFYLAALFIVLIDCFYWRPS